MACSSQAAGIARVQNTSRTSCHDVDQSTEQRGNGSLKHCGEPHWFITQEKIDLGCVSWMTIISFYSFSCIYSFFKDFFRLPGTGQLIFKCAG